MPLKVDSPKRLISYKIRELRKSGRSPKHAWAIVANKAGKGRKRYGA